MSYLDDSPCFVRRLGSLVWGPKSMHWPTASQRSPHSYISPVPNWLLVCFFIPIVLYIYLSFCFGFNLIDLFDFYLGYSQLYVFGY